MVRHLPRLLLAAMFCSIIGLGVAVKANRAATTFVSAGTGGITFGWA